MSMKSLKFFLLLFIMPACFCAHSAIYSYITKSSTENQKVTYDFVIQQWDKDDATPNPCYNQSQCYIMISHRHTENGLGGAFLTAWSSKIPCVASSKTIGELGQCVAQQPSNVAGNDGNFPPGIQLMLPFTGNAHHVGDTITQECVGLFWGHTADYGSAPLPGSVCGIAPPPIGACGMPDEITLDHGDLPKREVDGNIKTKQITIDCNQKVAAKFYLQGLKNGKLPMDDSALVSTISLNDTALDENGLGIDLQTGNNLVNISSTLSVSGDVSGGSHTGQGILILALQ